MIVQNIGYLKINQVQDMLKNGEIFSIYKTHKNTYILIKNTTLNKLHIYYPKQDKLPYKNVEGKKIVNCDRVYSSSDGIETLNISNWNNKNQIMSYEEFSIPF